MDIIGLVPSSTTPAALEPSETSRPPRANQRNWVLIYALVALLTPLLYVGFTHHVWEDFLIDMRQSKNLVEGQGLVYNPGQRVQGFTSVVNIVLPAIFYALSGRNDQLALNIFAPLPGDVCRGRLVVLRLMLAIVRRRICAAGIHSAVCHRA